MVIPAPEHRTRTRRLRTHGRELLLGDVPIRLVGYGAFGALTDPGVDLERLFGALHAQGLNLHRTWAVQSGARRPGLPVFQCMDGRAGRYDLTAFNPEFIDRLRLACSLAGRQGIVLQITLFAPPQCMPDHPDWEEDLWSAANNLHGSIEPGRAAPGAHVHELYFNLPRETYPGSREVVDPALYHLQKDFVQSVVQATAEYWNVIYEIAHEARCYSGTPQQCILWHREVAGWIKTVGADLLVSSSTTINPILGDPHRISPAEDGVCRLEDIELISLHYHAWRALGAPMAPVQRWSEVSGWDLAANNDDRYIPHALSGAPDGCGGYFRYAKPVILDDDGAFGPDETGRMHRDDNAMVARWAAAAIRSGAHFNHKDSLPGGNTDVDHEALAALSGAARPDFPGQKHRRADLLTLIR